MRDVSKETKNLLIGDFWNSWGKVVVVFNFYWFFSVIFQIQVERNWANIPSIQKL